MHSFIFQRVVIFLKKRERVGGLYMKKSELKRKLTSRKLWMSIASFISMLIIALGYSEHIASEVAAIIMAGASIIGYVIGEGLADSGNNQVESKEDKKA
jgi:hypothetical protein